MIELVGGYLASSIAIYTDAAHLASDVIGFAISLTALRLSENMSTALYTFGWSRYEVLGTLLSIFVIWAVTAWLVVEATFRFIYPQEIQGQIMLGTAGIGLVFNIIQMKVLHSGEGHYHLGGEGCAGHDHDHDHAGHDDHHHHHGHGAHDHSHHKSHKHHLAAKPSPRKATLQKDLLEVVANGPPAEEVDHKSLQLEPYSEGDQQPHLSDTDSQLGAGLRNRRRSNSYLPKVISKPFDKPYLLATPTKSDSSGDSCDDDDDLSFTDEPIKKESNLNLDSATIHIIGDIINSVGVICAATIIYFYPDLWYFDPVCTYVFSIIVMGTTVPVTKKCFQILLETTPEHIDLSKIEKAIFKLNKKQYENALITEIHDLHVWSISSNRTSLTCHIMSPNPQKALSKVRKVIERKFHIYHSTI